MQAQQAPQLANRAGVIADAQVDGAVAVAGEPAAGTHEEQGGGLLPARVAGLRAGGRRYSRTGTCTSSTWGA
jgi:hypothetical protein